MINLTSAKSYIPMAIGAGLYFRPSGHQILLGIGAFVGLKKETYKEIVLGYQYVSCAVSGVEIAIASLGIWTDIPPPDHSDATLGGARWIADGVWSIATTWAFGYLAGLTHDLTTDKYSLDDFKSYFVGVHDNVI